VKQTTNNTSKIISPTFGVTKQQRVRVTRKEQHQRRGTTGVHGKKDTEEFDLLEGGKEEKKKKWSIREKKKNKWGTALRRGERLKKRGETHRPKMGGPGKKKF